MLRIVAPVGREHGYRRYTMAKVDRALALAGLKEIERRSAPPRAGMARRLTHLALRLSELGNAVAFAARRIAPPPEPT